MTEPDLGKNCPRCNEIVKSSAAACRFCGQNFMAPVHQQVVLPAQSGGDQKTVYVLGGPRKNSFQSCMGCVGWCVVILLGLYMIGATSG